MAEKLIANQKTLHLIGLCSDGGVHSHINHLCGLLEWAKMKGIQKVAIHAFTDGRDTPAKSAWNYLNKLQKTITRNELGEIATLCGRYWSMDSSMLHACFIK